jgi:Transcriptional Coactivator p15 (PC4)
MSGTNDTEYPFVIGSVQKNSRDTIRVAVDSYKGHTYLDVRIFANGGDDPPRATKQGVTIKLDKIAELRALLEEAEDAVHQRGLA